MTTTILSFVVVLGLTALSGVFAVRRKKHTTADYLLASRDVKPWLTALSTVGTNNSGFMFVGMIAYTYSLGLQAVWMMAGWVLGDLATWFWVHARLRKMSEAEGVNSLPGMLARSGAQNLRPVAVVAGLITISFLGVYAAGQLKAGSTALHALFGWDMSVGALIGTGIVLLYSYAGGIRADIWTDAAQSFVMIGSMLLLLVAGYLRVGGWEPLMANLQGQEPALVSWFPEQPALGFGLYVTGFVFAGLGVVGQPHLMTRIMAIESVESLRAAGGYYFGWYVPFYLAALGVGLYCRAVLPELTSLPIAEGLNNPEELALPLLTMELLPEVFVGVALAGLFAATISTADSQIIVCSGTLTQDIFPRWSSSYVASKVATIAVAFVALVIAWAAPEGVFGLVLIAWSALAASLAPLLVIRLYHWPISTVTALAMMVVAVAVVSAWHFSSYADAVFASLPGTVAALFVYGLARFFQTFFAHRDSGRRDLATGAR